MQHKTRVFIEYYCRGWDRPYSETKEITGKATPEDMQRWHEKLLAMKDIEEVRQYRTYTISEVTLDDGEKLVGEKRNFSPLTVFDNLRQIPDRPRPEKKEDIGDAFNGWAATDAWKIKQLQSSHAIHQRQLKLGYTHLVPSSEGIIWLKPGDPTRVFDRATGQQTWPLPGAAPAQRPRAKKAPRRA